MGGGRRRAGRKGGKGGVIVEREERGENIRQGEAFTIRITKNKEYKIYRWPYPGTLA